MRCISDYRAGDEYLPSSPYYEDDPADELLIDEHDARDMAADELCANPAGVLDTLREFVTETAVVLPQPADFDPAACTSGQLLAVCFSPLFGATHKSLALTALRERVITAASRDIEERAREIVRESERSAYAVVSA